MSIQPPDPPDNLNQGSNRRLTLIGVSLWLLVGAVLATLVFTDIGGGGVESAFQIAVGVGGVILIAVVGGAIVYQILKRLNLIGSLLINVFWAILFMIALPVVGWIAVQEVGLITSSLENEIINALPINREALEVLAQARELLTGEE